MIGMETAVAASLAGAALGVLWGGWGLGRQVLAQRRAASRLVDEALAMEPARSLFAAMAAHFPADARTLRRKMIRIAREPGSAWQRQVAIANAAAAVRRGLGVAVLSIPGAEIDALLDDQIALYRRFEGDALLASRFVVRGIKALSGSDPDGILAESERIRTRVYRAMAQYRGAPVGAAMPVVGDYERLQAALARVWGMDDAFAVLDRLDPEDPRLGVAFLTILKAVRHGEFEGADRLRRAWVVALANG